jgi:hypothetical protein
MKSTTTPLAIHIMRIFLFSSSSWFVIDPSFFGMKIGIEATSLIQSGRLLHAGRGPRFWSVSPGVPAIGIRRASSRASDGAALTKTGGARCGAAPARLKHGAEALSATVSHAPSGVEQTFRKICML